MKKQFTIVAIIGLVLTLFLTTDVFAYNLLGGKHETKNLNVRYMDSFNGNDSKLGGPMSAAISDWHRSNTKITMGYNQSYSSQIGIKGGNYGNTGWSARCTNWRKYVTTGNYTGSTIEANYTYLKSSSYSSNKIKGVFSHELGHALGLAHTTNTSVVMHPNDNRIVYKPAADDVAGVNSLYK